MQERRVGKRQVTYRLDTRLLDCIDGLRALYPRFNATDIVDLMLKGFIDAHDIGLSDGEEEMDKAVGRYLRGDFDERLEELYEVYIGIARRAAEPPSSEE